MLPDPILMATLLRAVAISLIATLVSLWLTADRDSVFASRWGLFLLFPLGIPPWVIGFCYSQLFPVGMQTPWLFGGGYILLMSLLLIPVGVVMRSLAFRPSLSATGAYCFRLLAETRKLSWRVRLGFRLQGRFRTDLLVFAVCALLAFQEFDLSSFWGYRTWSVALFDAHAGGLPLEESWRRVGWPVVVQMVLVMGIGSLLALHRADACGESGSLLGLTRSPSPPQQSLFKKRSNRWGRGRIGLMVFVVTALLVLVVAPLFVLWRGAWFGLSAFLNDPFRMKLFLGEIGVSLTHAILSAVGCWLLVGGWRGLWHRHGKVLAGVMVSPVLVFGLCGPLVISLTMLRLFQSPGLSELRQTSIPVLLALILNLLPRAVLIDVWQRRHQQRSTHELTRLLANSTSAGHRRLSRRLYWEQTSRRNFWMIVLLSYWSYFDVMITSLLMPIGLTPAGTRLFNLMHYGQNDLLSAMILLTLAIPILLISLFLLARKWWPVWLLR